MVSIYLKIINQSEFSHDPVFQPEGSSGEWRESETEDGPDVSLQRSGEDTVLVTGNSLVGEPEPVK